ncbi:histidine phosphatase family protein [Cutibacterium avidum]|uniref:Histidine phosphatase family protein n=1 Tax=Cutibacterium avidum TaxID=33010 RepID=A0A3E2DG45_9ACTN|nr:histidine phosphatase family protein [Cutibacterium avidum]RFT44387.1 histidine phosphatase family protein [Cutibacterium avidum]TMT51569.1 histidine phosphatase family protein [Cutibacterium avidum]
MTTRIVLVRHGETEFNADGRLQGQLDIPLSSVGIAQAEAVAPVIAGMDPVAIVSSPLVRARVTAETIGRATGLEVGFDDRLKEVDVGQWAGETVPDLHRNDPHYTRLMASGEDFRRSDGETTAEVAERVTAAVRDAVDEQKNQAVCLVAHGFALRAAVVWLLGGGYPEFLRFGGLGNCSWTVLDRIGSGEADRRGMDDRWRLRTYNATVL